MCWSLGVWFPKAFPEETIPPKLHILIVHIPEMAMQWRTVGLLSEHTIETMHHEINRVEEIYRCVPDKEKRTRLVFGHQRQRVVADKSGLVVQKRKCVKDLCNGYYAKSPEGKRCKVCKTTYPLEE